MTPNIVRTKSGKIYTLLDIDDFYAMLEEEIGVEVVAWFKEEITNREEDVIELEKEVEELKNEIAELERGE